MVSLSEGTNQDLCSSLPSPFNIHLRVFLVFFLEITMSVHDRAGNT